MTDRTGFPVVAHVFLIRSNSLLLLRRCDTGFEDGNYGLPGGHVELGESIAQAAVRECREEIGVLIKESSLSVVGFAHYTSPSGDGIDVFLKTSRWRGTPMLVAECDDLCWREMNELPENTLPFIRRAIDRHLRAGKWFDEIGWESHRGKPTREDAGPHS